MEESGFNSELEDLEKIRQGFRLDAIRSAILVKLLCEEAYDKYFSPKTYVDDPKEKDDPLALESERLSRELDEIATEEGLLKYAKEHGLTLTDDDMANVDRTSIEMLGDDYEES